MGKVLTHMTMSLDGYVADPDDQPRELFDWYGAGEVAVPSANPSVTFKVDEASAEMLRELTENVGALVSGRRLFDLTNGWNDSHPVGAPVVVVTHSPPANAVERWPRTTFVDGVAAAVARARQIPATRTSRSPVPTSSSRRWTSAWWTRCVSAWCRCYSARASATSPSQSADNCCSRTRRCCRDAAPFISGTRSPNRRRPATVG